MLPPQFPQVSPPDVMLCKASVLANGMQFLEIITIIYIAEPLKIFSFITSVLPAICSSVIHQNSCLKNVNECICLMKCNKHDSILNVLRNIQTAMPIFQKNKQCSPQSNTCDFSLGKYLLSITFHDRNNGCRHLSTRKM